MLDDSLSELSSDLSSPPLSPVIPPDFYPTPTPSQDRDPAIHVEEDMQPARKRRKVERKPRTTQTLDLTSDTSESQYDRQSSLETLIKTLQTRKKIVVVAGAGISVSAGIPDFRSAHGLFNGLKKKHSLKGSGKGLFDASVYKDDTSTSTFHDMVRDMSSMASEAKPTLFHRLLARLSKENRLLRLYTQNIDGIDTSLPPLATTVPLNHKAPWPQTIQLHGGLETMMCQKCRQTSPFQPELFQGGTPPACPKCVESDSLRTTHAGKRSHGIGKMRPRIVLYNEHNPDEDAIGSVVTSDLRTRPDCIIVVGTSMKIPGVKRIVREMCGVVRSRQNGVAIWVNLDPVPATKEFEDCWDLVVKGNSDEVARVVNLKEWDDDSESMEEVSFSEVERVKSRQGPIEVVIPESPLKAKRPRSTTAAGILTPPFSQDDGLSDASQVEKINFKLNRSKKVPKTRNPASNGRSISQVLDQEKKPKAARKPKASLEKKTKAGNTVPKKQSQLAGKITKPIKVSTGAVSAKHGKAENAADKLLSALPNGSPITIFPNLLQDSSTDSSPNHTPRPKTWTPPATVSPTGAIPNGMRGLIH